MGRYSQEDIWYGIAKKIYGTENGINVLLEANLKYRDIIIFSGGILLNIPEYTAPMINNLPPWRR